MPFAVDLDVAFLAAAVFAFAAAARVCTGLSLEVWELERAFSPFADDEVSDLLLLDDLSERLSIGIFSVSEYGAGRYARWTGGRCDGWGRERDRK